MWWKYKMEEIKKYAQILVEHANQALNNDFNLNKLEFDDFSIVNSNLIYKSIQKKINVLISFSGRKTRTQFYIPVIFTLAICDFTDNYIDSPGIIKIGDIFQLNGKRYEVRKINSFYELFHEKDGTWKIPKNIFKGKGFILTTAPLTSRTQTKFNDYKRFFIRILNLNSKNLRGIELPSSFIYKSIIVTDKKIVNELKKYNIDNQTIHKAFPFRYITKSGIISDNIPIDPMIYIVNDYQTARKYILDKNIKIRNVIFIGANKYNGYERDISEDINNKIIDNCIFVGSSDIQDNAIPNLYKWKWTLPELNYFKHIETKKINVIPIESDSFDKLLEEFTNNIKEIETDYGIDLNKLYHQYVTRLLPIVISNPDSRLIKQLDNILDYFQKEAQDFVETIFFEIGEYDYEDIWGKILEGFIELIKYKKTNFSKFNLLDAFQKINYLVVPKENIEIWKEEKNDNVKHIISFKEFKELKKRYNHKEFGTVNILFLGFYGYDHLKEILYSEFSISLLLYQIEVQYYNSNNERFKRETYNSIKDNDRKKISDISFKQTETEESVSELIRRLFGNNTKHKIDIDYTERYDNSLCYEITFDDGELSIFDENKTVLLKTAQSERTEKVKNLREQDQVRIYDNSTKEDLYKIALEADKNGSFSEIEQLSKLWKSELHNYSLRFNSIGKLLNDFKSKGLSISNELTLKHWIKIESKVKFPQRTKDLAVLKNAINSPDFDNNFLNILSMRRKYNGIMIALGRDLSDDITGFIKTEKKGNILKKFSDEQVRKIVIQNAKLRGIKSIKVVENE
jgi:hypothetical protein